MAKYYITVGDSMTQATNVYAAVQTLPDGGTLSTVKVPPGMKKITVLGSAITPDVISLIDTGNNFTLKFTGTGLSDGDQEISLGALANQETGVSVAGNLSYQPANYTPVDINVKPGEISLSAAYDGTDGGTPFIAVTLGFE